MTELEYVISKFDAAFDRFKGQRIILHGSREYAVQILSSFDSKYHFSGIITLDDAGIEFAGKPVYRKEQLGSLRPDLVILTERVKYEEAAYNDIAGICSSLGIQIFNMYGLNEVQIHYEYEHAASKRLQLLKEELKEYDIVIFEFLDGFMARRYDSEKDIYYPRPDMKLLCRYLRKKDRKVLFSLRRSFPKEEQIRLLKESGLFDSDEELKESVLIREGEDLSLRKINEKYPELKKCYFGWGLVNEFILPACYGIKPYRVRYENNSTYDFDISLKRIIAQSRKRRTCSMDLSGNIRKKILAADIVCFDVFDTLITRKALSPEDALEAWGRRACRLYPDIPSDITRMRIQAQNDKANADIYEIYKDLKVRAHLSKEQAAALLQSELDLEEQITERRDSVCDMMDYAVREGKKVYLISDTYYPEEILRCLLAHKGISTYDRLITSCDNKKMKYEGLFDLVQDGEKADHKILLFGNDPAADIYWGRQAGFETVHTPSPADMAQETSWRTVIDMAKNRAERGLLGTVISGLFNDPFKSAPVSETYEDRLHRFASSVCAPAIAGYMTWLLSVLRQGKYDKVLFSSRDGYIIWKIYREYLDHISDPEIYPEGKYFYISRHAAFLTCMDDPEKMEHPLYVGSFMTGREVISHFYDIPDSELEHGEEEEDRKDFLMKNMRPIREKCRDERAYYLKYLEKNGITAKGRYALTDFVAMGTSQAMLEAGCGVRFDGFYFGMPVYEGGNDSEIRYYICNDYSDLQDSFMEMEYIMTSPESSLLSFDREGNPVFAPERRSRDEISQILKAHEIIEKTVMDFLDMYYSGEEMISPELIQAVYSAEGIQGILKDPYDDWGGFQLNGTEFFPESLRRALLAWYPFREGATVLKVEPGKTLPKGPADKYDYVVIKELPERGTCDLEEEFAVYKKYLKPDGILLVGFHNAQAARYKCGGLDEYVTDSFDTHRLYERSDVLAAAAQVFAQHRCYYPMPDPSFVQAVFTDGYIPAHEIGERVFAFDAFDSPLIADENIYYNKMIKNGTFADECNYYLIEMGENLPERHPVYAVISADREKPHALATILYSDETAMKKALYPEGLQTLRDIASNLRIIRDCGLQSVECTADVEGLKMPYCREQSAMDYFEKLAAAGDPQEITEAFVRLYKDISVFTDATGRAAIEMIPLNAFVKNGEYIFFDQEYTETDCPGTFVIWRALFYTYLHLPQLEKIISRAELMRVFEISTEKDREYYAREQAFLKKQRQIPLYRRIHKWMDRCRNIKQDS